MPDQDAVEDRLRADARTAVLDPPSLDEMLETAMAAPRARGRFFGGLAAAALVILAVAATLVLRSDGDPEPADHATVRGALPFAYVEVDPDDDTVLTTSPRLPLGPQCLGAAARVLSQDAERVVIAMQRTSCRAGIRTRVTLHDPIDHRTVVDASTRHRVPVVDTGELTPNYLPAALRASGPSGPFVDLSTGDGVAVALSWTTAGGHDRLQIVRATGGASTNGDRELPGTPHPAAASGTVDSHPASVVERTQYNGQVIARCLAWRAGDTRFRICSSYDQVGGRLPSVNPPAQPIPSGHLPVSAAELHRIADSLPS